MRLTCARKHVTPKPSIGLYLPPSRNGQSNRHVCELTLPAADNHVGSPCHCGMNCVLTQHQAKSGVVRTRRHAPNCIAWVNVFKVEFRASLLEMLNNLVLEIQSHVTEPNVSRRVPLFCSLNKILPRAFGYDDHGMAAMPQPVFQRSKKCFYREPNLGNEAEVDVVRGNRCECRNKSGLSPHQLYEPDPVSRSEGFRMSSIDGPSCFAHSRDKTEGHVHSGDVIVNGLRDTDN